jgi:hypothetical protein
MICFLAIIFASIVDHFEKIIAVILAFVFIWISEQTNF